MNRFTDLTTVEVKNLTQNEINLIINYRNNPLAFSPDKLMAHYEFDLDELIESDANRIPNKITITIYGKEK